VGLRWCGFEMLFWCWPWVIIPLGLRLRIEILASPGLLANDVFGVVLLTRSAWRPPEKRRFARGLDVRRSSLGGICRRRAGSRCAIRLVFFPACWRRATPACADEVFFLALPF